MKHHITILLLTLLAFTANAGKADEMALNGNEMYRQGEYAGAIQSYEGAIAEGKTSANLYYNLGNAYYRHGDMTHAILNYERALRLKPSMRDAKENLALARSKTVDQIEQLPQLFVVRLFNSLCTNITPAAWRIVWLVLLALLAASVAVIFVGNSLRLRRWGLGLAVVVAILLIVATIFTITSTTRFNRHADAIVIQQSLAVKSSPELQSADKLILHEGTRVHITESLSGWNKISIADGTTGWCQAETIERI